MFGSLRIGPRLALAVLLFLLPIGYQLWAVGAENARAQAWVIALPLAAALGAVLLMAFRTVVRPLRQLEKALLAMANGDLDDVSLPPAGHDEIGQIALAGQTLLERLRVARAVGREAAAQHARRDRRQVAMDTATQDFGASISGVLTTLAGSAAEMRRAADAMAAAAPMHGPTTAGWAENARQVARATETSRAAAEVNRVAATLSGEVDNFLAAMRADDSERRHYERIPGKGLHVTLKSGAAAGVAMTLTDVSRGGCAVAGLVGGFQAGMEVILTVPSLNLALDARVARLVGAGPCIAFRQNAVTMAGADRLLAHVKGLRLAA